jgi:hypothetical protein
MQAKRRVSGLDAIEAPVSDHLLGSRCAIVVVTEAKAPDHGLNALGKPGDVG